MTIRRSFGGYFSLVLLICLFSETSTPRAQPIRPCACTQGDPNPSPCCRELQESFRRLPGGDNSSPRDGGGSRDYRHTLHDGRDPSTPPRTKTDTVPSSIPGIPGLRTRCQFMHSKVVLVVSFDGAENAVRQCVNEGITAGMVAAIVATIYSGGGGASAGTAVAKTYIGSCLQQRVRQSTIRIENPTGWGDWGGC